MELNEAFSQPTVYMGSYSKGLMTQLKYYCLIELNEAFSQPTSLQSHTNLRYASDPCQQFMKRPLIAVDTALYARQLSLSNRFCKNLSNL